MGVIPNPKMAYIFPISCILALIFPILIKYFPKCEGKGSFLKSQIKSLPLESSCQGDSNENLQHDFAEYISFEKKIEICYHQMRNLA